MNKGTRAALARSKSIDHQLDAEREKKQREIQLLVLGGAGSGKSTFIKQLRINYGDGFPELEREKFNHQVHDNVVNAINTVLDQMKTLQIPFDNEANKKKAAEFQERNPKISFISLLNQLPDDEIESTKGANCLMSTTELTKRFAYVNLKYNGLQTADIEIVLNIWEDSGVQRCYKRRAEYKGNILSNGEQYFLENMKRVLAPQYIPTLQDILYIRRPTFGVIDHYFYIDDHAYRVIDVAGQKSQRKKWIHFFEMVTSILFFVPLSEFDEYLEEDKTLNSVQDSLQTFHEVSHNQYLERTDFLLFLNKYDLFVEKLKWKRLQVCFPDYDDNNTPEACVKYIRELFHQHRPCHKHVYTHVSCATDVSIMRDILSKVLDIITEINLRKAGTF
ncbi:hypothetical protein CHS0354_041249 [Potamilus streckersoni]|uniref:Uncharacterized protein n=1 Tax=Potamilus streckersoni TaxID=2493646 RepID=A0AAE0VUZ7_9BIVA|nr:hypothetical protein CHS0354_041249 [Potamilus streckersoni]